MILRQFFFGSIFFAISLSVSSVFAEPSQKSLSEVVVEAKKESKSQLLETLPESREGVIFSGKKSSVVELEAAPAITTNNYRQAFSQLPGLLTSEVSNESFASFSYRGLGDPHESNNLNILRDGVPIAADLFGYPGFYYQPPIDSVERIEFVRGGAGLSYGAQVGGALNFISRKPNPDKELAVLTKQVFGSKGLYSTYNELSGTSGDTSYIGFFHLRQSDGFRDQNSDYQILNGNLAVTKRLSLDTEVTASFDAYNADHGEAGGLTLESGDGLANYNQSRFQSSVTQDRITVERYAPSVQITHKIDSDTTLFSKTFGGYYRRFSHRQNPGTAAVFGGIYNAPDNTIQLQEFYTLGFDNRLQHEWQLADQTQIFSAGFLLYGVESPFEVSKGDSAGADTGALQRQLSRSTRSGALFVENRFKFGNFKVTPGLRLEQIGLSINEQVNNTPNLGLRQTSDYSAVLLPGLGVSYDLGSELEAYANASSGYRPKLYSDVVPLSPGDTVSNDLDPAHAQTYEVGLRGAATDWLKFDTSTFLVRFEDQFGRVENSIQNVGNSRTYGLDLSTEISLTTLIDKQLVNSIGDFKLFANASFLNAEYTSGPVEGKTPQYAPKYMIKTGAIYQLQERTKLSFLGTMLGSHFADDGNTANRFIPSYAIWDLTTETELWDKNLSLVAGVNNVFNQEYYSRIRGNGIDPGLPRNSYLGAVLRF